MLGCRDGCCGERIIEFGLLKWTVCVYLCETQGRKHPNQGLRYTFSLISLTSGGTREEEIGTFQDWFFSWRMCIGASRLRDFPRSDAFLLRRLPTIIAEPDAYLVNVGREDGMLAAYECGKIRSSTR